MTLAAQFQSLLSRRPKLTAPPDPPGVTIPAYIPAQLKALSWLATIGVFYMLWLFSVGAAADAAAALHITHAGGWVGDLQFWFPVVAAYLIIAWVVAWTGKVAVPAFVSLRWLGDERWPKAWMLVIMIAVSAVIIGGSVVVQTETRFEGNREAAVAVEQVQRGRAAIEAERDAAREELNQALSNTNAYLNQAANVGAAEWERSYVAQARATNDPRLPQIERALGAARRADELRAEIRRLTTEVAQAPTDASVTQRVATSEADQAMGGFVDWIGAVRAIMLAILQDIACLLLPWIAMRTEQARNRQLAMAEPREFDAAHAIEDMRDQPKQKPEPAYELQTKMYDEDGNELVRRRATFAKKPVKGKKAQATFDGERLPDEAGVQYENDARVAMAAAGVVMAPSMAVEEQPHKPQHPENHPSDEALDVVAVDGDAHAPITTTLSPEAIAADYSADDIDQINADFERLAAASTPLGVDGKDGVLVDEPEQYGPPAPVRRDVMEDA